MLLDGVKKYLLQAVRAAFEMGVGGGAKPCSV